MPRSSAIWQAWTGPAPPKGTSVKSRRSKPRSVEMALIASRHLDVDDPDDAVGGAQLVHTQRLGDLAAHDVVRGSGVETELAVEEVLRVQVAEDEVRVGDGRGRPPRP